MKKFILSLLLVFIFPLLSFSQTDLSRILFQLIDSKSCRYLLEDNGWYTRELDSKIDFNQTHNHTL
tara:strand:- start:280 stop:477 length:198 start_codon:yes stop_codon:yes gene_type:complete